MLSYSQCVNINLKSINFRKHVKEMGTERKIETVGKA